MVLDTNRYFELRVVRGKIGTNIAHLLSRKQLSKVEAATSLHYVHGWDLKLRQTSDYLRSVTNGAIYGTPSLNFTGVRGHVQKLDRLNMLLQWLDVGKDNELVSMIRSVDPEFSYAPRIPEQAKTRRDPGYVKSSR